MLIFVIVFSVGCGTDDSNTQTFNNVISYTEPITVDTEADFSNMVEDYAQASVTVIILSEENEQVSMGSGIAVYAGGYIATNWHVISAVESLTETYFIKIQILQDGEFVLYDGKLLWSNINFDLAVVRCEFHNIPYVTMADRWIDTTNPLRIAEYVWTIGSPVDNSLAGTFTDGKISSNMERNSVSSGRIYESLIQHTANISNGSSGSGLFDKAGNLVALNTLGITSTTTTAANSLYFSTPIYPIYKVISKIVQYEQDDNDDTNYSLPLLEVKAYDSAVSQYYYRSDFTGEGVYVYEIKIGGTSYLKLLVEDVITAVSIPSANVNSTSGYYPIEKRNDLLYALCNFNPGDTIYVYYTRGTVSNYAEITLV